MRKKGIKSAKAENFDVNQLCIIWICTMTINPYKSFTELDNNGKSF